MTLSKAAPDSLDASLKLLASGLQRQVSGLDLSLEVFKAERADGSLEPAGRSEPAFHLNGLRFGRHVPSHRAADPLRFAKLVCCSLPRHVDFLA